MVQQVPHSRLENNRPFRNLLINGDMQVAQRSTSVTGIGASAGYFTLDRFDMYFSGTAGRLTMSQTAITDLPGLTNCLKLDCTTADAYIAASEQAILQQHIEGQNLQQLKKGTSSAEKTTVSFYVKGDQAATYTCALVDNDNSRQNGQTFSVTTSWNRVVLVFDGDTTGAYGNDNGASLRVHIYLQMGSTFTGGTFSSNTWESTTSGNTAKSDQTQFFDSTDRELFITGFQYEVGDTASDFEHLPFDVQLARCHRYYYKHTQPQTGNNEPMGVGIVYSDTQVNSHIYFKVPMRTSPSLVCTDVSNHFTVIRNGGSDAVNNWTGSEMTENVGEIYNNSDVSGTAGHACTLATNSSDASLSFSAEL